MWKKYIPLVILIIPYAIIAAVEIIEALICSVNYFIKCITAAIKGIVIPNNEKEIAKEKVRKEWKDVGDALAHFFMLK